MQCLWRGVLLALAAAGTAAGCSVDRSGLNSDGGLIPRTNVGGGADDAGAGGGGGATSTGGAAGGASGAAGSTGAGGSGGGGAAGGSGGRRSGDDAAAGSGGTDDAGSAVDGGDDATGGAGGDDSACHRFFGARAFVPPTDGVAHCYWAHADEQTWSSAQQACLDEGGDLVTILSEAENGFVAGIALYSSLSDAWIGGTDGKAGDDTSGPGSYRWVTDEPWGYANWYPGEPDGFCDPPSGGPRTCDHRATLVSDGTWSDRWPGNPRRFVCEATP